MTTRTSSPVSRAPARLVADDGAAAVPEPTADAALTPPTSPVAAAVVAAAAADSSEGGSTPRTQHHIPHGLTMTKIQELSLNGRLERTACLSVESLTVQAPDPPDTVFGVYGVINSYSSPSGSRVHAW